MSDETVYGTIDKITVEHGPDLESYSPDQFPAWATVQTEDDGEHTTLLETCRSDPANPLTETELVEKYETLATRCLDENDARDLGTLTTDLASVDEIGEVTAYLRG